MNIVPYNQFDFSGGVQDATTYLLKKSNDLRRGWNLRFTEELGGFERRPGNQQAGSVFSTAPNPPLGGHAAKFSTGTIRMVAVNNNASSATIIRTQNSGTGVWSDLAGISYPVNSVIFFFDYLDEVYVSGFDPATGDPVTPYNIDKTLNVSATRNLLNAPSGYFFCEYLGVLYLANLKYNSTRYPDRVQKASAPLGAVTFVQGAQTGLLTILKVDSVRYLKPGMVIDVYAAGTEIKTADIIITTVDKVNNTISFAAGPSASVTSANVNAATDVVTSTAPHGFITGDPILLTAGGTAPTGLTMGAVYYVIYLTTTTFKLATTYVNAIAGTAIDITAVGSGTNTFNRTFIFADNDEIWLDGRKGTLNVLWNTDYPNPQATGEFLAIKPGTDSSNVITAIHKSSNRLFIWTRNSGTRWDGSNLVVFNNSIGCISHRSVQNIDDDWLIWMDARGNIRARNESNGQQEKISRPMRNVIKQFTQTQFKAAAAGIVDQTYKIYLGTNVAGENIRLSYDFESNTWSPERLGYPALIQINDDYTGELKPYFFSNNGYLYIDETGNLDDDKVIAFEAGTGPDIYNSPILKRFYGILLFTENCSGLKLEASVDGDQMKTLGVINDRVCWMKFNENGDNMLKEGVTFDWQIMGATEGDPPKVRGAVTYYILEEKVPSDRRP